MRLQDKTAIITGGSSGIGLAVACSFLSEGARVAILGRDEAKLRQAGETLGGGDRLTFQAADVGDPEQMQAAVRQVVNRFGPVDVLVNNAGLNIKERTFRELTPASWRHLLRANLDGAFFATHAVLPAMLERKDGVVIFISSIAGKRASPLGGIAYAASKFGMRALGLGLAAEEKESGIRVSVIYPGEVDTPILESRPQRLGAEHRRHILQPQDVAEAVLFVATLPPRVSVPELVIKPTTQLFV